MPQLSSLRVVSVVLLSLHFTSAQNCYYPNGVVAEGMAACTAFGGSCCPLNWECLSNGLCYLDNEDYYGRYTCTDKDWASGSQCPEYCTQNDTAAGNEAIQHCPDGSWCCDGNRDPKNNCCDNDDAVVLALGSARQIALITSTAATTPVTGTSSSRTAPSTISTTSSSISSSTSSSSKASPTAITTSAVTSDSAGIATTIFSVITSTPSVTSSPSSKSDGNRGLIVGLGVGVPSAVLACAALGFLLWRLRRKRQLHEKPPLSEPPGLVDMYRTSKDTPELDNTSPESKSKVERKSELYGSTPLPMPHSPAISSVTATSEPPYYSPTSFVGPGGVLGQVQEEPSELWGGEIPAQQWPGQQPYRAPEPEQRMSQTFRVSQQDFTPYRPPNPDVGTGEVVMQPKDY